MTTAGDQDSPEVVAKKVPDPIEANIRQYETKLAIWWARWKFWHLPTMTERYFGNVENEFAYVQPPSSEANHALWQKAEELNKRIQLRRKLRLRLHLSDVLQLELLTLRLFSDKRLFVCRVDKCSAST